METVLGGLIILVGFGSAVAYIPLQLYTGIVWRGVWRIVALVPLLLMVPVFVITANALAQESNLWPIVMIFVAPVGTGYLVILMVIRRLATRPPNIEPATTNRQSAAAVEADQRRSSTTE